MKFHKITVLVFLGCAAFVLGNAQAPLDDDEFDIDGDIDGSGFMGRSWSASGRTTTSSTTTTTTTTSTSTSAPKTDGSFYSTTSQNEPEVDGSGSGDNSDDEDDDTAFSELYPDEYDDSNYVDSNYEDYSDEETETERSWNSGGGWGSSKSDDVSSETERENVGVVHTIHPVDEKKPVLGGHKPKPVGQPAPTPEDDYYDGDDYDDDDLVIPPEGTLEEINNVREELEKVKEKEIELEEELERQREDRIGDMDGLGTKAVDRDTSFFAQPGILAAVVGGAVVGLLCAILLVMLIVYRMRKKDEGSYPVDEPKRSLTGNNYSKNKDYYA